MKKIFYASISKDVTVYADDESASPIRNKKNISKLWRES